MNVTQALVISANSEAASRGGLIQFKSGVICLFMTDFVEKVGSCAG